MKISRNNSFDRHFQKVRSALRLNTQKLREKTLRSLEELFTLAEGMAKNVNLKMKQRQLWARIAAYIAQIINCVAESFDERQIDIDLKQLEKLVNEARSKKETKSA